MIKLLTFKSKSDIKYGFSVRTIYFALIITIIIKV